jgi:hypothetical protein
MPAIVKSNAAIFVGTFYTFALNSSAKEAFPQRRG